MRRLGVVWLLVLLLGSWSGQVAWARPPAQAATVSLSLQPTVLTLENGTEFELLAVIESGNTLVDGAQVTLGFDPAYVRVLEIIALGDLSDLLPAPELLPDRFSNSEGRISYAAGKLFGTPPSGTIEIFLLRMLAVGATAETTIAFVEDTRFLSNRVTSEGQILSLNLLGSAVAIEGYAPSPTVTPTGTVTSTPTETLVPTDTPEPPATEDATAYPAATAWPSLTPSATHTPTHTETFSPTPTLAPQTPTDTPQPPRDEIPLPTSTLALPQQPTMTPGASEPQPTPTASLLPAEERPAAPPEEAGAPTAAPEASATPPSTPDSAEFLHASARVEPEPSVTPETDRSFGVFVTENVGSLVAILVIAVAALGFALVRRQATTP